MYNHFHNILRLFDVLLTFLFTTSETMRGYYTAVHSAVFTGHLVHTYVIVALIFCNNNSLIMRRELTSIH